MRKWWLSNDCLMVSTNLCGTVLDPQIQNPPLIDGISPASSIVPLPIKHLYGPAWQSLNTMLGSRIKCDNLADRATRAGATTMSEWSCMYPLLRHCRKRYLLHTNILILSIMDILIALCGEYKEIRLTGLSSIFKDQLVSVTSSGHVQSTTLCN